MSLTTNRSDELDLTNQSAAATRRILTVAKQMYSAHGHEEQKFDEITVDLDHKYRNKNMTELNTEWCGCCISLFGDTRKSQKWKDDTGSQKEIVTMQPTSASSEWGGQPQGVLINELENEMEINLQWVIVVSCETQRRISIREEGGASRRNQQTAPKVLGVTHRRLQRCVGTGARLGYPAFDAQLRVLSLHCTPYVLQCWWSSVFASGPRDMSTHDSGQIMPGYARACRRLWGDISSTFEHHSWVLCCDEGAKATFIPSFRASREMTENFTFKFSFWVLATGERSSIILRCFGKGPSSEIAFVFTWSFRASWDSYRVSRRRHKILRPPWD